MLQIKAASTARETNHWATALRKDALQPCNVNIKKIEHKQPDESILHLALLVVHTYISTVTSWVFLWPYPHFIETSVCDGVSVCVLCVRPLCEQWLCRGFQMYISPRDSLLRHKHRMGYNRVRGCPCIRGRRHIHYHSTASVSTSISLYPYYTPWIAADAHLL